MSGAQRVCTNLAQNPDNRNARSGADGIVGSPLVKRCGVRVAARAAEDADEERSSAGDPWTLLFCVIPFRILPPLEIYPEERRSLFVSRHVGSWPR
jgi:hypothetical protein